MTPEETPAENEDPLQQFRSALLDPSQHMPVELFHDNILSPAEQDQCIIFVISACRTVFEKALSGDPAILRTYDPRYNNHHRDHSSMQRAIRATEQYIKQRLAFLPEDMLDTMKHKPQHWAQQLMMDS
ncbi:MAG: hypothetical protein WCX61_03730 [Candidatus Peribacteraceae bacterium]